MKKKDNKNIEHRGNANNVADKLKMEMQLLRQVNQEKPVYSSDAKDNRDKKKVDFK